MIPPESKAKELILLLKERHMTITAAESCTGGLIAAELVNIPGASDCLEAGFITYSDRIKSEVLGIESELIAVNTAVSAPVSALMAEGALRLSGADMALSSTGYAGPGGGTAAEPVGTVYISCAEKGGETVTRRYSFAGDRSEVRRGAVFAALELALERLKTL